MAELTEELRVLVTAEVDKAIKNLKNVDKQTADTEKLFKSMGSTITKVFSAAAVLKFAKDSADAYRQQQQSLKILEATLKATGAEAWTSSGQLQQMASSLQSVTNYSADTITSMQSVLLGFKNIKGDQFKSATRAILDMATVMGMDLKSAAQSVGKALDDPIHGLDSLRKQGFAFTDAQKAMMQSMLDVGDVAGAQKIILDELESTYGGAAKAAGDWVTETKNSLSDFGASLVQFSVNSLDALSNLLIPKGKEGEDTWVDKIGKSIAETMGDWYEYNKEAGVLINTINLATTAFSHFFDVMDLAEGRSLKGDDWQKWIDSLPDEKKLQEILFKYTSLTNEYNNAFEKNEWDKVDALGKEMEIVSELSKKTNDRIIAEKEARAAEQERLALENEINELMFSIAQNYGKLSKDDPVIQLENYKKQLADIEKQREKLSGTATGIDTKDALTQLDYIEKKIREKIAELQADGKKSWQKWFSEITKIDENDFTSGADAAKLYLEQMEREFQTAKSVSEMLGVKFDLNSALKKQQDEIRSTLESLFNIDPSKINEAFTSQDASVQALIDKYKELSKAITETATAPKTWEEQLSEAVENTITKLTDLDAQTAKVFGNMAVQMSNISLDAAMTGFEEFGRALGEGKDAADSMHAALASMAQEILNQLPVLFLRAGLNLVATPGMWPLGLGLIAAAGSSAIIAGYVDGKTSSSSTEANALGGVYGADDYAAFAKGGTFTNAIVQSPTFFKFAKGSGFGTGLMGEAGPEAIMPLTRGVDGSLGVNASGVGANVEVKIPVTVYSDEPVEVNDTTDESGQRKIEIMVGSMINKHLSDGSADRALKSRYGLKVQGV